MKLSVIICIAISICVMACGDSETVPQNTPSGPSGNSGSSGNNNPSTGWLIPQNEVFDGGPGKDGIPALLNPPMIDAASATYLSPDDLVIGYKSGDDIRAYPHKILDWHEIINDEVNEHHVAITYCPLTGTGIGWERELNGQTTTFGVSGLLYNTNLIPYDRLTDSNWSQMRLDCVNGELTGEKIATFPVVETTWETWKSWYPDTKVVSTSTGFSRSYGQYPYGDYKTNHNNILFPFSPKDERLPAKERVLGVIVDNEARIYRFSSFAEEISVREDAFRDVKLIIVGSHSLNFLIAYERTLSDGTELSFTALPSAEGPGIMQDNEGNIWDAFGTAVAGPRTGEQLQPVTSYIGFWFAWGAFYEGPEI